ncbi:MAG: hypothetical protein WC619_03100 [Patescibacteria group bacterium]
MDASDGYFSINMEIVLSVVIFLGLLSWLIGKPHRVENFLLISFLGTFFYLLGIMVLWLAYFFNWPWTINLILALALSAWLFIRASILFLSFSVVGYYYINAHRLRMSRN